MYNIALVSGVQHNSQYLYVCKVITTIKSTSVPMYSYKNFFCHRTFKISFLSNFQTHDTVLLTIVAMLYITCPCFIYPSIHPSICFGCLPALTLVDDVAAAINMGMQMSLQDIDFISFVHTPRSGVARSYGSSSFNLGGTFTPFSIVASPVYIPINSV